MLAAAATDPVDCLVLEHPDTIEIESSADNDFTNCFSFKGLAESDKVTLYAASIGDLAYDLLVYDMDGHAAEHRARLSSEDNAATFKASADTESMGFRIIPTNQLNQNKSVNVIYSRFPQEGDVVVFIEITPVGSL
ncbi:hypothetical protein ACR0ST_09865 [Aliidiomarina sp. Khilg15.8]